MTPERDNFWPQGHNLNKLDRGPLGDATYQISRLRCVVSDKKIFSHFTYLRQYKKFDTQGGAIFGPRGIIGIGLVEVHLVILLTKYLGSRPCGFRQEDFYSFNLESILACVT